MNFAAGINKQDQKPFAATMAAFAALLLRGRLLAASLATMAGVLVRMTASISRAFQAALEGLAATLARWLRFPTLADRIVRVAYENRCSEIPWEQRVAEVEYEQRVVAA